MGSLDALNWKLSGTAIRIPCQVDLVIFFTRFLFSLSSLLPRFHFSSLFISLACLSHLLSFHHCLISHSQPLFPASPSPLFLSTTIFTRLCDMTGGLVNGDCDRFRWVCDTESFRTALLHVAIPTCWFVMHLPVISLCDCVLTWRAPFAEFICAWNTLPLRSSYKHV